MEQQPVRVLVFAMAFPPDAVGSGTYAHRLAFGLVGLGYQVLVLAPRDAGGGGEAFDAVQPFTAVRFADTGNVLKRYLTARTQLRRVLARYQPHVLWTTNGMATRVVGLTPELDGHTLPIITCMRGSDITTRLPGRGLWARLESIPQRRGFCRSAAIAASSQYLKQLAVAKGVDGARIFFNPSAFDFGQLEGYAYDAARVHQAYPAMEGKRVVVTVARLVRQKRVHVVLEAVTRVRETLPDVLLAVVGDGPEKAALQRQAASLRMTDRVVFAGSVQPMSVALLDLYSRADVFAMAGVREGMPNVFMEAGALGRASVGVADGGTPEVIQDGRTGLLAAPDDPEALAGCFEQLLRDRHRAAWMGREAQAWIREQFSTPVMIERSHRAQQCVLAGKPLEHTPPRGHGTTTAHG